MAVKAFVVLAAMAAFGLLGAAPTIAASRGTPDAKSPAARASEVSAQTKRRARLRIQVNPGRLIYRQCTDWYVLEYRPSGTVLVPRMRCWWVRG